MNAIERDLRSLFEDERRTADTPAGLADAVTARIGRRRLGGAVGATVTTLAVAGAAVTVPFTLSHLGSPAVAPGATGTTVVAETTDTFPNSLGLACGDPVPASLLASPDQTEVVVFETIVAMYPDANSGMVTTPLKPGSEEPDLYAVFKAAYPGAIIGRDGFVAGWTELPPQYASQISIEETSPLNARSVTIYNSGRILWCPDTRRGADELPLPQEGTYLVLPFADPSVD